MLALDETAGGWLAVVLPEAGIVRRLSAALDGDAADANPVAFGCGHGDGLLGQREVMSASCRP